MLLKQTFTGILLAAGFAATAQVLPYTDGHQAWDPDSLGNHRAVLSVPAPSKVAYVRIDWRRRDEHPENKRVIVTDAQDHRILNVKLLHISREYATLLFDASAGKGIYHVYYMPYKNEGRSNYPRGVYLKPDTTASAAWLAGAGAAKPQPAQVKELQAVDAFNSFYPMEVIATAAETKALLAKHKDAAYLVFPEDKMHAIRMPHDLPYRWIKNGVQQSFAAGTDRGCYFAFQLGVYALQPLENVQVHFSDLRAANGTTIAAGELSCINTNGRAYDGSPLTQTVNVPAQSIQPLWCGLEVPAGAAPGVYNGTATVQAAGQRATTIALKITVNEKVAVNGGVNEPANMTRVNWLNSDLAQQNTVIAPYTPLQVQDSVISLLGRRFTIGRNGMPLQVESMYTPEMTSIGNAAHPLLTEAIHFHFNKPGTDDFLRWKTEGFRITQQDAGTVSWAARSTAEGMTMDVQARLEFDGFVAYTVKLTALQDLDLSDIKLHIPMQPEMARYMMGLGLKGGTRPDSLHWKWDVAHKNQDGAWTGNVNGGLQFSLRDENYVRPLNTNFYLQKPLHLPTSWGNENKGGIDVYPKGKAIVYSAYSGARSMKKGDVLYFNFNLLITPFHPLQTDFQWTNRFYHKYDNLDTIKATGATVINIHHGTPINPWINYPFIEWKKMKDYIDEAHSKGLKVKMYNTIRELSDHAYELPVLRSLGHEVYSPGKGGGFSWLQEHVDSDYIAAWFVPEVKDAAIINSGMNRWHNYYVEGMNWLVRNVGIDGIYLDDVAFDRVTMKRIKRVLTQDGHPGIIDLHSANQYNKSDGFNNSANLYMENFPYLNRLWFGEYFDYQQNSPDFFLTEVSGIPFGLMGEMLQDGGNPWRGMVYGMTNRLGWTDVNDPRPLWKLWAQFGMEHAEMIGYWSPDCPVKTGNDKVLATVYKQQGRTLVAIASWAPTDTTVQLDIDWKALGIDPAKASVKAPAVAGFQEEMVVKEGRLPVAKGQGYLLWIE